jgi:hypothetical protein
MTRKYALIVDNKLLGLFNIRACAEIYAQGLVDCKIQVVEL